MDDDLTRHNVGFAEGRASVLLCIVINIGTALYRSGIECQVFLATYFIVKTVENTSSLEYRAGTYFVAENSRRMRLYHQY